MNIELVKSIGWGELEGMIRSVPLNKPAEDGSDIMVYQDAGISLREMGTEEVNPTTFYLIRENLAFQERLREYMKSMYGVDTMRLEGALILRDHDKNLEYTLTPPIIEVTNRVVRFVPQEGELAYGEGHRISVPIINDGAHRVFVARQAGDTFSGVHIVGANPAFPFYAHPNSWDEVNLFDDTPSTKAEKKMYSREDCYALYRNFGAIGCGAPRNLGEGNK